MLPTPQALRDADDTAWSVYADALLAQGDLRGELIHLQLSGNQALTERERMLLASDARLGGAVLASLDATWRRGYLSRVRAPGLAALKHLLTHPSGALLDELIIDNPHLAIDELVDAVNASRHAGLRRLEIRSDSGPTSFEGAIDVSGVLRLASLRHLVAAVRRLSLGGADRSSVVEHLELSATTIPVRALGGWSFPRLRTFELSFFPLPPRTHEYWPVLELPPLRTPVLESLRLRAWNIDDHTELALMALVERAETLKLVDLSACQIAELSARQFRRNPVFRLQAAE